MKKLVKHFIFLGLIAPIFMACDQNDPDPFPSEQIKGCYVFNYGLYDSGGSSITKYNSETEELTNYYYRAQNNQLELLSNIQHAGIYNDSIYLIGNAPDQLITLDPLFRQTRDGISEKLANPRYFVGHENYLYISCYGENPDWADMPSSYIAKFSIENQNVEKIISLPGGPEGMAVAHGKLFVAMNFIDSIAVISLDNDHAVSYIATPSVTSYFVKDAQENLWVTLVSTHSDPSMETGLGYINTTQHTLETVFPLNGVSSGWSSVLSANSDGSRLYLLASDWVEEPAGTWVQKGAAYTFDPVSGTFALFAGNLTGANGIVSNPANNDVYILTGASVTEAGSVRIYTEEGQFIHEFICGVSPYWAFFLE